LQIYNKEKESYEEILYMSIKLAYKTVYHELPITLKILYCKWSITAQNRLDEENEAYSQHAREFPHSCGKRGTDAFNYFHGKKWAAKFMVRFMERVMVHKKSEP
jgi:hypothetical protein